MTVKPELLSPAGNMHSFKAAVQAGADAVYLGVGSFNARQSADNFNINSLKEAIDYAHIRGVKIYLTTNTLVRDIEMNEMKHLIEQACLSGVDAFIVQDMGVLSLIGQICPTAKIHASTQMSIHNLDGVKTLESMGVSRVVLARELSKEQISYIIQNSDIETEVFVHGALCMSCSGQCLMSSIIGSRSGNRGKCAQPCRMQYQLINNGETINSGYLLSPKDNCLIDYVKELADIGVTSFKIEGRLKKAEYVAAITKTYRKYIDFPQKVLEQDKTVLLNAFNRTGFTDGYFSNKTGKGMMAFKNPSNMAENIYDDQTKACCEENANLRKVKINIKCTVGEGMPLSVTLTDADLNIVTVQSQKLAEKAINLPLSDDNLKKQMLKLGNTPFVADNFDCVIDGTPSLSVSVINETRRLAIDELTKKRTCVNVQIKNVQIKNTSINKSELLQFTAEVNNIEQAEAALGHNVAKLYIPPELERDVLKLNNNETQIVIKLPDANYKMYKYNGEKPVLASNIDAITTYTDNVLYANERLNCFNSLSVAEYKKLGFEQICLSTELNLKQIEYISRNSDIPLEIIGYGYLPVMMFKNCPVRCYNKRDCGKNINTYILKDRYSNEFKLMTHCDECYSVLLNSKPLYMADKLDDIKKVNINYLKLLFTVENFSECDKILYDYRNAHAYGNGEITRGHFYRGV